MIEVIPPGAIVLVGKEIAGRVVQVCIQKNKSVQYQVSWFDGNDRKLQWLEDFEVMPFKEEDKMKIGFNGGKK